MLDSLGPYTGTVTRVDDPEQSCRVMATVPDLFSDAETGEEFESPWIEAMTGGGSDCGIISVPPEGSPIYVWVEFSDDINLYRMCYTRGPSMRTAGEVGTSQIPHVAQGKDDESVLLKPSLANSDIQVPSNATRIVDSDLVGGGASEGFYDAVQLETVKFAGIPPSANASEYPHNHCIKTPNGILCELDDTPNARRIHLYHPSGAYLEINDSGTWIQRQTAFFSECGGQRVLSTGGHKQEHVGDYITLKCEGKHTEWAGGNRIILANQVAIQGETNIALNSLGRMAFVSDGQMKIEAASGLEVSTGGAYSLGASSIDLVAHGPATHLYNERFNAVFSGLNPLAAPPVNVPTSDVARVAFMPTLLRSSITPTGAHINLLATPGTGAPAGFPAYSNAEGTIIRSSLGATTFCIDGNETPSQSLVCAGHYQEMLGTIAYLWVLLPKAIVEAITAGIAGGPVPALAAFTGYTEGFATMGAAIAELQVHDSTSSLPISPGLPFQGAVTSALRSQ